MSTLTDALDPQAFPDAATQVENFRRAAKAMGDKLSFFDDATIVERRDQIREENSDFLDHILFVAEDAGGVLYGIWVRGSLAGMWSILDHHEVDLSPAWRNTDDFIANGPTPSLPDSDDAASAADHERWAAVRAKYEPNFQEQLAADADGVYTVFFAYTIIALTPRSEADSLIRFLTIDNQWIAERAAATLGEFEHKPAIEALTELSKKQGNGAMAARGALKRMGA